MVDKLGQEIKVGSYIVYGHALGRCAALRLGKVLRVEVLHETHRYNSGGDRITVQGIEDGYYQHWNDTTIEPSLTSRVGTLQFSDRTIVLDPALIPAKIKKLLDEAPPLKERKGKKAK